MAKQSKAVLCREWNKPVVVETITVESPKRGEVMVKIGACGVCQSDHSATNGTIPLPPLLERLHARGRAFCMTVVGDGSCRDAIAADFARRGLGDRVRMTGYLPPPQVERLYFENDIRFLEQFRAAY